MTQSNNQETPQEGVDPMIGGGYDPEAEAVESNVAGQGEPSEETTEPQRTKSRQAPARKSDEWRRNLSSVFGHGAGRFTLIAVVIFVIIFFAVGLRMLSGSGEAESVNNATVQAPNAPETAVDINPVSEKEAERRYGQAAEEAGAAQAEGGSYQPAFIPNIVDTPKEQSNTGLSIFQMGPAAQEAPLNMSLSTPNVDINQERKLLDEARQRRQQEYDRAVQTRDQYVSEKQKNVLDQLEKMLKGETLNALGVHTNKPYPVTQVAAAAQPKSSSQPSNAPDAVSNSRQKPVIRTGNLLYAETISEINTDKGQDVLAVVRGGQFNGAKLIGKIENRPDNIGVRFSTLAPQDGRSAFSINAVALRTEDASQGIAEDIDHHTLSRYTALAASSLLSGFGKAYENTPGTAVVAPSGTTITTTEEPSSRQVTATVVGELGTAISEEVRRGFNRPSTYSTPAGQGFAVFFLADAFAAD